MKNKSFGIALILMLLIAGGGFVRQAKAGQDPPIGPYTVINLPLEDLPQYDPGFFYNPIISGYPGGGSLQVLYVLKDPRDVPLARYGYWDQERGSAVNPNNRIQSDFGYDETLTAILDLDPITINVYVRVQAPDDDSVPDPLFWSDEWGKRPSLVVPFDSVGLNQFGGLAGLGCAVPEYATDQKPYGLLPDIDGGDAINKEGLYDPKAYAPPLPWYPYGEASLRPGEVREGWISCMSPDVPLDEIVIHARHIYTEPPLPTPFSTFEAIEEGDMDDTEADEECVQVESFDDPECLEAECCTLVLVPDSTIEFMDEPVNESTAEVVETADSDVGEPQDIPYGSSIAWGFKKAEKIPGDGLVVENVDLTFSAGFDQEIADTGTVIIKSAYVTRTELPSVLVDPDGSYHDYQLIALVRAEPHSLSVDDLAGYELQGINLDLNVYMGASDPEKNAVLRYSGFDQEAFYETGAALEGYAHFSLEPNSFAGFGNSDELPIALWFEAENNEEQPSGSRTKYPVNGLNIRSYSLESQTSMCEVVDCQEVNDPNEEIAQVRTVPVFCPGEWANNFTISGMRAETVDFFGIPPGLVTKPNAWADSSRYNYSPEIWLFEGEILGGLAPWWIEGHETEGYSRRSTNLEGTIINSSNGNYLDIDTEFLPLYDRQVNQRTYYAEVDERVIGHGWMPGLINQGFVIAGRPEENTSFQNKLFMFQTEGPIWARSCSRQIIENHKLLELYSSRISSNAVSDGEEHVMTNIFPGMEYPLSMPRITGDLYSIGEIGETAYGYAFKPTEVDVVPGRQNNSIVYVREEDKFYPADERVNTNNEAFFRNVNAEIIPPGNSLVFVKIEKDPPGGPVECQYINNEIFHLTSPGLFPATSQPGNFRLYTLFTVICPDDFSEAWLVFIVPTLDVDIDQLIFTIRGEEYWSMWRLD